MSPGMAPHRHRVQLLQTGFRYGDRAALFARARLYPDRIELTDWSLRGTHSRMIALSEVDHVEWTTSATDANATLVLAAGERVPLRLKQVSRWQQALEQRLSWATGRNLHPLDLSLKELVAYTTSMS